MARQKMQYSVFFPAFIYVQGPIEATSVGDAQELARQFLIDTIFSKEDMPGGEYAEAFHPLGKADHRIEIQMLEVCHLAEPAVGLWKKKCPPWAGPYDLRDHWGKLVRALRAAANQVDEDLRDDDPLEFDGDEDLPD